jgi:prepilin-type N-terminal cleavage/methylation domain-containing protein
MNATDKKGFTLVEVVIVLAVIAILSAVLVPMIAQNIQSARFARASSDTATIAKAIVAFYQDLDMWPVYRGGTSHYLLFSAPDADNNGIPDIGTLPGSWNTAGRPLSLHFDLIANGNAYITGPSPTGATAWNGPYLTRMDVDPWGTPYLVNARWLTDTTTANGGVYVISAGPGTGGNPIQTEFAFDGIPDTVNGNDVVFRIK